MKMNGMWRCLAISITMYLAGCGGGESGGTAGLQAGGDVSLSDRTPGQIAAFQSTAVSRNLVANPGFELDGEYEPNPSGWKTWSGTSNNDADYTEAFGGSYSGNRHGTHWSRTPYEIYTFQEITNLANGKYTLSAWVKGSGAQEYAQLEAKRDFGGSADESRRIPTDGQWHRLSLDVDVTSGQLAIGFYSKANAGEWIYFDDVSLTPADGASAERLYPASLIANVRDYGAKGDGSSDDTAAIEQAICQNIGSKIIYLPEGIYNVNRRLEGKSCDGEWQPYLRIVGQNRDGTLIRLAPEAVGFANSGNPRSVVHTASGLFVEQPKPDRPAEGTGNEAFGNYVENLTIDTGGHKGAIALDFAGSNVAAVRDVTLRGQGAVGLSLARTVNGPLLVKNLRVEGFDIGVDTAAFEGGVTLEHISLTGQGTAAIRNRGGVLTVRDLKSTNTVPAVINEPEVSFLVP